MSSKGNWKPPDKNSIVCIAWLRVFRNTDSVTLLYVMFIGASRFMLAHFPSQITYLFLSLKSYILWIRNFVVHSNIWDQMSKYSSGFFSLFRSRSKINPKFLGGWKRGAGTSDQNRSEPKIWNGMGIHLSKDQSIWGHVPNNFRDDKPGMIWGVA